MNIKNLANSREEVLHVLRLNASSYLHTENCAAITLLRTQIINWLPKQ